MIVIGLVEITNLSTGHVIKTLPSKPMTGKGTLFVTLHSLNLERRSLVQVIPLCN